MKMKLNLDDHLAFKKMLELCKIEIVFGSVLHENNKYYPQVFLDEFLYKL